MMDFLLPLLGGFAAGMLFGANDKKPTDAARAAHLAEIARGVISSALSLDPKQGTTRLVESAVNLIANMKSPPTRNRDAIRRAVHAELLTGRQKIAAGQSIEPIVKAMEALSPMISGQPSKN